MTGVDETLFLPRHVVSDGPASTPGLSDSVLDERTLARIEKRRAGKLHPRGWVMRRALAGADVTGIVLAFAVTHLVFALDGVPVDRLSTGTEAFLFALSLPFWVVLGRLYGLYSGDEQRANHSAVDDFVGVFNMLTVGTWLLFAFAYVFKVATPGFSAPCLFWLLAVVLVVAARIVARSLCRRTDAYIQNTLIVGAGVVGQKVARKLLQHPEFGVNIIGFVDDHPRERGRGLGELTVLGATERLPELVHAYAIERVIIAFSRAGHDETLELIRGLTELGVWVDVVPRLFDVLGPQMRVHAAEGLPLLGLAPARLSRSSLFLKRTFDIVVSGFALVVIGPLLAAVALAIKIDSPGPAFFRQTRMGRDGEFTILKLRTMSDDADARKGEVAHLNKHLGGDERMFKVLDDPRVTRIGRLLRRFSLDELPQLVNVLRGEMSLVGPRPLILDEDSHIDGWARKRLDLKPGITGLWQVLGRDDIPFEEMISLDYRYVTSWSLSNDLKLIAQTIPVLARGHDA